MNKDRTKYRKDTAYENFRNILWQSEISHGGKGIGPRMHDLRHTFAVHSLNNMVKQGIDIYCALPILSTYLGHASTASTEHYVRLTVEFFPDLIKLVNPVSKYVLPAVYHETY
ncbi:MAG: tyrosine-type recombinase/integrase [Spirochaetia bacterium]|nr:tyrosine-type recombinase/integrase [Spirochaetia bacterium]